MEKIYWKCYVINFLDEVVLLLIEDLGWDMFRLVEFLNKCFDGGMDIELVFWEVVYIINGNDFCELDIVLILDFEMLFLFCNLME